MAEEKRYAIDDFLDAIRSERDDRGYLARLRRGLSENTEDQAWGILAAQRFDFTDGVKRKIWATVGGLAATLLPDGLMATEGFATLGAVLKCLMHADGKPDESRRLSYEGKLRRLLNCSSATELCDLVVAIVRMADAKGVTVNCRQLYFDLNGWDDCEKREKTRVQWTKDFYRFEKENDTEGESKI